MVYGKNHELGFLCLDVACHWTWSSFTNEGDDLGEKKKLLEIT